MSLASVPSGFVAGADARDAICEALRTLPELNVSSTSPITPTAFSAWPKWALTTYVSSGRLAAVGAHEYDVIVLLPNGYEPDTTAKGDDLLTRVVAALWAVGIITTAQPTQVLFDQSQAMPALTVRVIPHNC